VALAFFERSFYLFVETAISGTIGGDARITQLHSDEDLLAAGRKIRRAIDTTGSLVAFCFYPNRERDQNYDGNDKLG
jgi:hypothetical protein